MNVKIFDLAADHLDIQKQLVDITDRILTQGEFILGPEVRKFEESYAAYFGMKYAVGVASGTDAIKIAGLAMGLSAGDKIVTTPNTYIATVMSLSLHGIVPVFCDIEEDSYNMDPAKLQELFDREEGVKLCVPIHLYGHPCRIDEIVAISKKYGVPVLEDTCQAHGALYNGRKAGTFGDASAFSFYPTKNLGCYGDGGLFLTNSDTIYEKSLMLRNHGQKSRHNHVIEGYNSRLDELQAAILNFKLSYLDEWNKKRRVIAGWYRDGLAGTPLILPKEEPWGHHVYHLYVVRTDRRDALMKSLAEKGITTLIHYPTPIHLQEVYRPLGYSKGSFPQAERAAEEIVTLPMYPSLAKESVDYVCESIRAFFRS